MKTLKPLLQGIEYYDCLIFEVINYSLERRVLLINSDDAFHDNQSRHFTIKSIRINL